MRCASRATALALLASLAGGPGAALAQVTLPSGFVEDGLAPAFDFPTSFAFLPGGGRILVVEQRTARIRLLVSGALSPVDPVATLPDVNSVGTEQGLLGIAVDPGWPARPYLYVHCDNAGTSTIRISRYTATGDLAFAGDGRLAVDPASRYDLLDDAPDQAPNHNGGTLRFGLDGMLYASLGDDASCGSQDTVSLRGVILRLDVSRLPDGPGGPAPRALVTPADNPFVDHPNPNARLVWAIGLRNPFRFQVDSFDGSLWVGDVGEASFEEIDHVVAGGHNFGWSAYEAMTPYPAACAGAVRGDDPVYFYDRRTFTAAVICAGAYRRPAASPTGFPLEYEGNVFLSDYYHGFLRRLAPSGSAWAVAPAVPGQPEAGSWGLGFQNVSDWAVGPDGALYYCRQADDSYHANSGAIRRIHWTGSAPPGSEPVRFYAPYPSPAAGAVQLSWLLPGTSRVALDLLDAGGREVRHLVRTEIESAGAHGIAWDGLDDHGRAVRPGIYLAHLVVDGQDQNRRIVLLR